MAVGIYTRVSTAGQIDNTSLNGQSELCKAKAKELNFSSANLRFYSDGQSGEDIDTRPELTKLREDVSNGVITDIICTHPDRFSRDLTDKLIVCREIQKNGAKLHFTDVYFTDSADGQLFFNIMSSIASYELALIRKRTIRGRLATVRDEKKIMPMRVAPFGYDKDAEGQLVINKPESQYVRMIYEWYVFERLTLREIGERLYGKVMPKRAESPNWNATSISRILTSEIYIGKYYYNRRAFEKKRGQLTKGGKPKKTYSFRDEKDWLLVEVTPIVDKNLWDLAQQQRKKNTTNRHVGSTKYQHLLKSLLKCAHCGRRFDATTYSGAKDKVTGETKKIRSYRCPNTVPRKYGKGIEKCKAISFNAELIENYVWNQAISIIDDPQKFVLSIHDQGDDSLVEINNDVASLEKKISKKVNALTKAERLYFEAEFQEEEQSLDKVCKEYKKEIASLKQELETCQRKIDAHRLGELTADQLLYMVNNLREKLANGGDIPYENKRYIIEMLFDEISVKMEDDDSVEDETKIKMSTTGLFDTIISSEKNIGVCTDSQEIRQHRRRHGGPDLHRNDWTH